MQGIADRWSRFDAATNAASRIGGFFSSIAGAMQNWNDNTQARSAGVRDRVVRVRLEKNEGGMNLNMPETVIGSVAAKGGEAADKIIARFLAPAPEDEWDGWSAQRWARLDVFLCSLSSKIGGLQTALSSKVPHARSYDDLQNTSTASAPPGHTAPLTSQQKQALNRLTASLEEVATAFRASTVEYPNNPLPEPELRARSLL